MEDEQDIFDASFDGAEVEPKAEPVTEQPQEQPASEPEPPAAEQPDTGNITVPIKPEPGFVPFGAVLDERDKRKKLEAEVEELRKQRQEPPQPVQLPDVFEDPEGYTSALTQTFETRLYQQSLQMSERFAKSQYGEETTNAALAWATAKCDADPYFNAQVRQSGDPVGFAVQQYQRDQIVSSVTPDDFKQFTAWKQAQAGLQTQPAPSAQVAPVTQAAPPKSLASAPSAGSVSTEPVQSDEEVFAETFARK